MKVPWVNRDPLVIILGSYDGRRGTYRTTWQWVYQYTHYLKWRRT
jgi:hypothetical protein